MDLNTVTDIARPSARADLPKWTAGDAWLAGGTWLFSEPQNHLRRLIDLQGFGWAPLTVRTDTLQIAATCTIAELDAFICPSDWIAAPLIGQCCRAFLASFKIWKTATVGGNICMALPAGPMTSLAAALDGICTIWAPNGEARVLPVRDFVLGNKRNALKPGELLRQIDIPLASLRRRAAFRQISLTPVGRSAALLIGSRSDDGAFALTVTASTVRPIRIAFAAMPTTRELDEAIDASIPFVLYHADVHGKPDWRKAMTLRLGGQIRDELA